MSVIRRNEKKAVNKIKYILYDDYRDDVVIIMMMMIKMHSFSFRFVCFQYNRMVGQSVSQSVIHSFKSIQYDAANSTTTTTKDV